MIRVGERGENKFKKVSWEEAFDFIAKKLGLRSNNYSIMFK